MTHSRTHAIRTLALTLALALIGIGADAKGRKTGGTMALVNVRVISMNPEVRSKVRKRQTVVIEDGRIVEIGPAKRVEIPAAAEVINGKNKLYVLPGLADMHVHNHDVPLLPEKVAPRDVYALYLANGVTTLFDLGGFRQIFKWRKNIDRGKLVGPDLHFTSPLIDEDDYSSATALEEDVRAWVRQGYGYLKSHSIGTPEIFDLVHDLARELDVPVVAHALRPGFPLSETLDRQPLMIAHIEEIYSTSVASHDNFEEQLAEPLAQLADSRVWVNTTVNTYEMIANTVDDENFAQLLARPEMAYLPPTVRALWELQNRYRRDDFGGDREFWSAALDIKLHIARRLVELGALDRLLLGTDATTDGIIPGFSIHDELRLLERAGLSAWQALLTGTYNPAVFFGVADEVGTVEEGKRADLLIVKKNPLKKIGRLADPAGILVNGVWLPEEVLEGRLEELADRWAD